MMRPKTQILLALLSFIPLSSGAAEVSAEVTRLRGFAQHQKADRQFDKARQSGERAFFEEEEQWENARRKAMTGFKKEQIKNEMSDYGPQARADEAEKKREALVHEKNREAYAKQVQDFDRSKYPDLVSEMTELGLDQERPRYDYRKRKLYGDPSKFKSGSSSSGPSNGGGSSFPPPPTTFDDFGGGPDGGYVPAPNMDDFGDVPPPPPPPPFGDDQYNEYIPPPPPPFEGETDFGEPGF
ncbi:hypothetical protein D3C87_257510 [compost metagenome]